jgi:aspartokinase
MKVGFCDRQLVIATMHHKEQVIAPLVESQLGVTTLIPSQFNTDQFGTFTRDIKRKGTQIEAARHKILKALELTGKTLGIASEGSFSPHPVFPLIASNREIVLLVDLEYNLDVIGQEISTDTNYNHCNVKTVEEALEFAEKTGFPEHGLVVMVNSDCVDSSLIYKGITQKQALIEAVETTLKQSKNGQIHIETDMRAMFNPSRMKVIGKATQNLINLLHQECPQCQFPGFDVFKRESGLPCGLCGFPTDLILSEIYHCRNCNYQEEKRFPQGNQQADPTYCQYCNP